MHYFNFTNFLLLQIFRESNPIEVKYSYPVEESAAIIAFEANIDSHEIEAVVKEKEKAKQEYNQAIQYGNSAILLEETAPDIFRSQSFTSLMVDLHQYINIVCSFRRCLNGTFF